MVSRQDDRGNGQLLRRFLGLLSRFHHGHEFALQLLVVHEFYGERMTQGACKALQVLRLHIHGDFPIGRGLEDQGCLVFFQIHACALLQFLFFYTCIDEIISKPLLSSSPRRQHHVGQRSLVHRILSRYPLPMTRNQANEAGNPAIQRHWEQPTIFIIPQY